MDDLAGCSRPLSRSHSPLQGRIQSPNGSGLSEGPEVALRQAEWDRQIESLDQREIELHQTQLKLIREQTASFMHELSALRQEVVNLKAKQETQHAGLTSTVDGKTQELKDCLERHRADHEAAHSALHSKVRGVESSLAPQLREMEIKLGKHGSLLEDREDGHGRLMDLVRSHADTLAKVTNSQQEEKRLRELHHGGLNDRLDRLEKERLDKVEGQHAQLTKKFGTWEADLNELRELVGGEKNAREAYHGSIRTMQDSMKKHFSDEKAAREQHQTSLGESLERRLGEETDKLHGHHASLKERLDYIERMMGDSADRHAAEIEAAHSKLEKIAASHGQLQSAHAHHATMAERLQFLEQSFGDSAERHQKELKAAHDKIDQLHGRLGEHHSQLAGHSSLQERVVYLEKVMNDSADSHAQELAAAKGRLEQMHGRLAAVEKSGASLGELQKAHSGLASDLASRNAHHASLAERVGFLEKTFGDSADKHSAEIEALKASHAKHESSLGKHAKDFEGFKGSFSSHATIEERLEYIEKAMGDSADKHSEELSAAHARLKEMHSRLSVCEVNASGLGDLRKAHADLSSDKQTLQAHHASLKERVEYLENSLGDSADAHAKDLQGAHTKLEQLHSRLAACEKHGASISDLQKAHAGLASQDSAHAANHTSLKERLDYLETQLGDSAGKHEKELESLKSNHSKHAEELKSLRSASAQHSTLAERMAYLEQAMGDSADKHSQEIAAAHAKLESMHTRMAACEQHGAALGDLKKSHSSLSTDKATLEMHHATLKERVDFIEGIIGDSADKHGQALEAAHAKLDQLQGRLNACERHGTHLGDLQKSHAGLANDKVKLETDHATLKERVDYLESLLGDSSDRHSKELESLKAAHAKLMADSKGNHSRLNEVIAQEKEARDGHHASVQERLNYLESILGDSADKHEKHIRSLEAQKASHAKLSGELKALDQHHACLSERLQELERTWGDLADKHSQELQGAHAKIESLHGRMAEDRTVREAHGAQLENLRKAQDNHSKDKSMLEGHHSAVTERLDYLEKVLGESADKHAREIEALKASHNKLQNDGKGHEKNHASMMDRLAQATREKEEVLAHHASLAERVEYLESVTGDSADHKRDLESIKANHAKHAKDLEALNKVHEKHASIEDRLEYIEKTLGDSADRHAQELAAAHSKIEHLHGRMEEERNAREAHHGSIGAKLQDHQKAREAHHASMQERLAYLESLIGDAGERHSRDLDKLASEFKGKNQKHATLEERLEFIEKNMGDNAEKHMQDRAALHSRLDQMQARFAEDRVARDAHHGSVQQQLAAEKESRDGRHATLVERVQYLEGMIGDNAERHTRELEAHKAAHAKLINDCRGRDGQHASLAERMAYLEKTVGDSAEKHTKHMEGSMGKLDQMFTRLSACERQHSCIGDLQRAHASLSNDKTQLEAHHATLKERVDFLESTLGDNVDKHAKALDALRKEHTKLLGESKVKHSQIDVQHSSVSERLAYVEKCIGDSADKHKEELDAAHAKIETLHGRLSQCEASGKMLASLKQAHASLSSEKEASEAHHSSLGERLDYLERIMGDSADRHSQELSDAHRKIEQMHGRLGEERSHREGHHSQINDYLAREKATRESQHASVQERLEHLEAYHGQSSRDFQSQHGNIHTRIGSLEQRVGDELAELREHLNGEKHLRTQHHDAVAEHLDAEKKAREVHERGVQSHLTGEKKARELHEQLIQEQMGHERQARDRHQEHMHELLSREKDAREKLFEVHQQSLQRETNARDATHKDLYDTIAKEKRLREEHYSSHTEFLNREKSARRSMEDLLQAEKAERAKHHETVSERVDSLQRTVNIFDSLIRKEMEERTKENRRVWDAIDNHTHDLSTQIVEVDGEKGDPLTKDTLPVDTEVNTRTATPQNPPPSRPVSTLKTVSSGSPVPPIFAWSPSNPAVEAQALQAATVIQRPTVVPMVQQVSPHLVRVRSPVRESSFRSLVPGQTPPMLPQHALASPVAMQGSAMAAFDALDRNHDGIVTRAEFNAAMGSSLSGSTTPQARARSPATKEVHVEQITCGHTRFPGERHHSVEVLPS